MWTPIGTLPQRLPNACLNWNANSHKLKPTAFNSRRFLKKHALGSVVMTDKNPTHSRHVLWLVLAMSGVGAAACSHDDIDRGVDRITDGAQRTAEKMNGSLKNANDEVRELGDKLPSGEEVKADLREMGQDVREGVREAGHEIRREARVVRDKVEEETR